MQPTHFLDIYNSDIPSSSLSLNQNSIKSELKNCIFIANNMLGFWTYRLQFSSIEESPVCTYILHRHVIRSPWNYQCKLYELFPSQENAYIKYIDYNIIIQRDINAQNLTLRKEYHTSATDFMCASGGINLKGL